MVSAHGVGQGEVADSSYRTVKAVNGLSADLHELVLTSSGTALVTAYQTTTADLSSIGGPRRGKVSTCHAQEVDLSTGKVLFDWTSLDHVGVQESYQPVPASGGDLYDYFHVNSVGKTDDGNLLISARNTWTVYKVDRGTGAVLWRLNAKKSDFQVPGEARFEWQHHASWHGDSALTVFDNAVGQEPRCRGLLLSVDEDAKVVALTQDFVHPAGFVAETLGSAQLLEDGRVFVGWGDQPYLSEFSPEGALLLDGQLPFGVRSYRAFTVDWVGHPVDPPAVAAHANPAGGFVVYASWNGATQIANWRVEAGASKASLRPVGSQQWTGFEIA